MIDSRVESRADKVYRIRGILNEQEKLFGEIERAQLGAWFVARRVHRLSFQCACEHPDSLFQRTVIVADARKLRRLEARHIAAFVRSGSEGGVKGMRDGEAGVSNSWQSVESTPVSPISSMKDQSLRPRLPAAFQGYSPLAGGFSGRVGGSDVLISGLFLVGSEAQAD